MKKIRIGVFGGARGFSMIDKTLRHPHAELVAVCDKYEPLLKKVDEYAKERGQNVALYTSFDEFIKHDMDAVVLANYANEHAIYAVKCLKAGKHVMSEVMAAETPAQLVELVETVEKTGLVYAYAENYCYMRAPLEMWKRYKNGDIGEIQYAEGEYIHDCSSIWPEITYGQKDHWRNNMFGTFYCSHSCGPVITITGKRPVKVVGFETNLNTEEKQMRIGMPSKACLEMITLENGAVVKSIHGGLKMEPGSSNWQIYGTKGMMESGRYRDHHFNMSDADDRIFNMYQVNDCPITVDGNWTKYDPTFDDIGGGLEKVEDMHDGSDFYTTHCFVEKILGNPDGQWSIDVYTACDMNLCGMMAWRSILDGNEPKEVPDFRIPEVRDRFRDDNACCTPEVAGDMLLPTTSNKKYTFPDEVYENVRKVWERKEPSPIDDIFDPRFYGKENAEK